MKNCCLLVFIFLSFSKLLSVPAAVVIIRHGEKQVAGYKTGKKGKEKKIYTRYLSAKGWRRAAALVPYFTIPGNENDQEVFNFTKKFGLPYALFASGPSEQDSSLRPIETITPLANNLRLKIRSSFTAEQYQDLASYIMTDPEFEGKYLIISFEHKHIPLLAKAMGIEQAPKKWPNVFDRAWVTEFDNNGKVLFFQNLPQRLMYGDSKY